MKTKLMILSLSVPMTVSAFAAPGPCDRAAETLARSVIATFQGHETAEAAVYSVEESKISGQVQTLSLQAFGLSGEDSETSKTYRMSFRLNPAANRCVALESLELTEEN
jgi:hypothetical protein